MSEPVTTIAGSGVAAGVISIPIFTIMGLAPEDMFAALLGCIIAQSLLPAQDKRLPALALWTLGSVLLSGLLSPVCAPIATSKFAEMFPASQVPLHAIRMLVAAALGVFAQPLLALAKRLVKRKGDSLAKEESA